MRFEQWRYKLPLLARALFRREDVEDELDDELEYHFERQVEENLAHGMSEDEARLRARRAIGNVHARKEECRDNWVVAAIDHLARDTQHALRTLRRDPGFTAGVFLLLALGIGANVAVFSVVESILLEPLQFREPDRLVVVHEMTPERSDEPRSVNALHFREWRECDCFEDVALAEYPQQLNLAGEGDPLRVPTLRVTPNAFSVLGVSVQIGRTFVPADTEPGEESTVVISDGLWRRLFGADPGVVGKMINLDGAPSVIIGVLPAGFQFDWTFGNIDVYRPWAVAPVPWWSYTNNYSYTALGRLADGVSAEAALEQLNAIQAAIAAEHFRETEWEAVSLSAIFTPLHESVTARSRDGLLLLLAAVGAALLVACLNIANLMLVRATARSREAGVRAALGASRLAIFRAVLIESALLAAAGAAAGVGLAYGALKAFTSMADGDLPRVNEIGIDCSVLLGALGLAVASAVAFGLLPALRMTRVDPHEALRAGGRSFTETAGRVHSRQALVTVEVGLSTSLLIVAGLLLVSFVRLDAVDRGFDPTNVLTAEVGLPILRYPGDDDRLMFYESLLERLRSGAGVVAAGVTSSLPLRGNNWGSTVIREGTNPPAEERPGVQYRFVSPGYLEAIGIPLLTGRSFDTRDYPRDVAILSEAAARLAWPEGDVVGRRFYRGDPDELFEVVGLVPDVRSGSLADDPAPLVYAPLPATGSIVFPTVSVAVRTVGDPTAAAGLLRNAVRSLDPELAISRVQTMEQIESASLGERRFQLILVVAFGAAALLIAALGTYSVLAYAINTRTHEIAMRMALGAPRWNVVAMVLRQGMSPVLLGLGLGIVAALLFGRFLASLLYSVTPTDASTLMTVAAVTLAAAFLASLLPARRAARTSLLDALRYE